MNKVCETKGERRDLAAHIDQLPRLARIAGQIEGIRKMIEDDRPCVDIIMQLRATRSALKSVKANIFERHLTQCISDTLKLASKDERMKEAHELVKVFKSFDE